jgi:N-carbamoylputrescine amidase
MKKLKISLVMTESHFGKIEENLDNTRKWAEKAKKANAQIVCFPELNITGYALSEKNNRYSEIIPGRITTEIEKISKSSDMTVIAGMVEKTAHGETITQVVISPEGMLGKYQKIHLSPAEKKFFVPGKEISLFSWKNIKFGIGLCFDAHFPEFSTICSLKGADVIFFPHASPPHESARQKRDRWLRYLPARSYDNSIFVAACNQVGTNNEGINFNGTAMILNPKGEIIAETFGNREDSVSAELDMKLLEQVRTSRMGYFLKERVPELYTNISKTNDQA